MKFRRIAVIMGGGSSEREISMLSGRAVASALREAGAEVSEVVADESNAFALPAGVEAVFPMIHGAFGEDGGLQARLDALGVPYPGNRAEESRVAFDKILSRARFAEAGVPCAEGFVLAPGEAPPALPPMPPPVVVKPPRQGSSVGVTIVREASQWIPAVAEARRFDPDVLVERFIPGREWTVPIIGPADAPTALPIVEVRPKVEWYDWEAKYSDGAGTDYVFPEDTADAAELALCERARFVALLAFRATGGRDMGRIDLRVDPDGGVFALENNTVPGCTSHSILPKAAARAGIPFPELCARIMEGAE